MKLTQNDIIIISGEGTGEGTTEIYQGKKTVRAIKTRLTKERCSGDRWAKAAQFVYRDSENRLVYLDLETNDYVTL